MSFPPFPVSHLFPAKKLVVVGAGQSLMYNWGSEAAPYKKEGDHTFLATLKAFNPRGTNAFVNSGDGTSALFRSTAVVNNLQEPDDYWLDDCGGSYTPGTGFYDATTNPTGVKSYFRGDPGAPTPTVGVRYTDMLADITAAGLTLADITEAMWCQGETEASSMRTDNPTYTKFTSAQYQAGLQWLFNKFRADMVNLRMMQIIGIGRRAQGANHTGFEAIRAAQRNVALANPTTITYGPECYDLQQLNEVPLGTFSATASQTVFQLDLPYVLNQDIRAVINRSVAVVEAATSSPITRSGNTITFVTPLTAGDLVEFYCSDTVHRGPDGNRETAKRAALCILGQVGNYGGNTIGPKIASATYDGVAVTATVSHDKGSAIRTEETGEYIDSPIHIAFKNQGGQLFIKDYQGSYTPIPEIDIISKSQFRFYPSEMYWAGSSVELTTAYGSMLPNSDTTKGISLKQFITDNAGDNCLPLRSGSPVTISGVSSIADATSLVQRQSVTLGTNDTEAPTATPLATAVSLGRCLINSLGVTALAGNVASIKSVWGKAELTRSGINMSRVYSGATEGYTGDITWQTEVAQLPAALVDFVMRVPFALVKPVGSDDGDTGATQTGTFALPMAVVAARSNAYIQPEVNSKGNSSAPADYNVKVDLASDGASMTITTGTQTDLDASETIDGYVQIIQWKTGVINRKQDYSKQTGNAASATVATAAAVVPANTILFSRGTIQYAGTAATGPSITKMTHQLTDANTITVARGTGQSTQFMETFGTLIELVPGLVSVQHGTLEVASGQTVSPTVTFSSAITLNKTMYIKTGNRTTVATVGNEGEFTGAVTLTGTNAYLTRAVASATTLTECFQLVSMLV